MQLFKPLADTRCVSCASRMGYNKDGYDKNGFDKCAI